MPSQSRSEGICGPGGPGLKSGGLGSGPGVKSGLAGPGVRGLGLGSSRAWGQVEVGPGVKSGLAVYFVESIRCQFTPNLAG